MATEVEGCNSERLVNCACRKTTGQIFAISTSKAKLQFLFVNPKPTAVCVHVSSGNTGMLICKIQIPNSQCNNLQSRCETMYNNSQRIRKLSHVLIAQNSPWTFTALAI